MKILSWNLHNLVDTRLGHPLPLKVRNQAGAVDVRALITNMALGSEPYQTVPTGGPVPTMTLTPVDLFVIIEVKCRDGDRGTEATMQTGGGGPRALQRIVDGLNTAAALAQPNGPPTYALIPPLRVSRDEAVGIIYRPTSLTPVAGTAEALQATLPGGAGPPAPGWLNIPVRAPAAGAAVVDGAHNKTKAPFRVSFTTAGGQVLHVVGIHASPGDDPATRYCRALPQFDVLVSAARADTILMGDFNICPSDAGQPFGPMFALQYGTRLADGTKTSLTKTLGPGTRVPPPPLDSQYLSRAYDNVIHNTPAGPPPPPAAGPWVYVVDLVRSVTPANSTRGTWNSVVKGMMNKDVSDHLPVIYEAPTLV